jgi:hypothetical protein
MYSPDCTVLLSQANSQWQVNWTMVYRTKFGLGLSEPESEAAKPPSVCVALMVTVQISAE